MTSAMNASLRDRRYEFDFASSSASSARPSVSVGWFEIFQKITLERSRSTRLCVSDFSKTRISIRPKSRRRRPENAPLDETKRREAEKRKQMDHLLTLSTIAGVHARSAWRHTPIDELVDEICAFSGCGRRGENDSYPMTFPIVAVTNALGRFGLTMDGVVPDAVISELLDVEASASDGDRASTVRLLVLLSCLCGGSFETKIALCFRALDAHGVRGVTEECAVAFARDCVGVVGALMEDSDVVGVDLGWAAAMWAQCVKAAVTNAHREETLGMFTLDEFKATARMMLDKISKVSMETADLEMSRQSKSNGERRSARKSMEEGGRTSHGSASSHGFPLEGAAGGIVAAGLEYLQHAASSSGVGAGRHSPANPGAIIGKVFESVKTPNHSTRSGLTDAKRSIDEESGGSPIRGGELVKTGEHRSTGSSGGINWTSIGEMLPQGIAQVLGVKSSPSGHVLQRTPGMSDAEWQRMRLEADVEAARRETDAAEMEQTVEQSSWAGVVDFVKELVIRIFLFNTVRLLLTIALLGGDAAICVYVIRYFGTVAGLGFVVVINVVISAIFIFFMLKFNKRETGQSNMQFGANLMQGIQDIANSKAMLGGGFNPLEGAGSDRDHLSPRSWSAEEEITPKAFGASFGAGGEERRFRRTVSGTVLGEQV